MPLRSAYRRQFAQRDLAAAAQGRGARACDVAPRADACGRAGAPRRALCVAHDAAQRLLAVGTAEGVVELLGSAEKGMPTCKS